MRPTRRWFCPGAQAIASYVDGVLPGARRSRVQSHLADCAYCRTLVADVVRIGRGTDLPGAPASLAQRATAFVTDGHRRPRRIWITSAALGAAVVCTFIAVTFLRNPQPLAPPSRLAPAAPPIPETRALPPVNRPEPDRVRNQTSSQPSPSVLAPKAGSSVTLWPVRIEWMPVPKAVYYQIRIVTSEGDPVWEGQSNGTSLDLPKDAPLKNGKYFVLLSALMEDGHIRKSNPVNFQIAGSR